MSNQQNQNTQESLGGWHILFFLLMPIFGIIYLIFGDNKKEALISTGLGLVMGFIVTSIF